LNRYYITYITIHGIHRLDIYNMGDIYHNYKCPEYMSNGGAQTPVLDVDDMQDIPPSEILFRGIFSDHIDSGNDFLKHGLNQIMTKTFEIERTIPNDRDKTDEDKSIDNTHIRVNMRNITIKRPTTTHYASSREEILTPKTALLEDKTYSAHVYADIDIIATATLKNGGTIVRKATADNALIVPIPIMVGGEVCHLHNKSRETLIRMEEDPSDPGGYYIVKGHEWTINNIESSTYNKPKIFRNVGHRNEIARLEIISKPGDSYENSAQLFIKYLTNNQLIIRIDRAPLDEIQIPFYILLRLLGWSSDKQMVDWIVYDYDAEISKYMLEKLHLAFKAKYTNFGESSHLYNHDDILRSFLSKMLTTYGYLDLNDEKTIQFVNQRIMRAVDTYLLPHIGVTQNSRHEKAIFITHLIRRLFMVEMKAVGETDRDSLKNKRAHSAGVSFAKAFKQQFNFVIVQPIKKQFVRDFRSTSFSKVDLIQSLKTSINSMDFERALSQAITTGSKQQITMRMGRKMVNRLTSQQVHRKNQMNYVSSMRQINSANTSSSKQSARANEMRRVHPTYTGYICPIQTQDGESVGVNKQLAISASITPGSSSILLKEKLMMDPDFIPLNSVTPALLSEGVAHVKVNGHWIGCVRKSYIFVEKYRHMRREQKINPYTTIYWDPVINEVHMWVDTGRLVRPLLIVYNNYGNHYTKQKADEYRAIDNKKTDNKKTDFVEGEDFKQWVTLTKTQLDDLRAGVITMKNLLDAGVIEYISPSEQENLLLSVNYDVLWNNRTNPLMRYTHCDIPSSLLGFAALNCPLGTHSPAARVILSTQQVKQACGWYSLSWPFRIDKEAFMQYHCEMPIVRTIANDFIQPNGINCIIAIQIYSGYNQEDSIILNKSAVQRGMFDGVHFTYEKSELEKNEQFGNPDISLTSDIKPYASYEKIYDGFPKKGTIIYKNDIVIGKYSKYSKPEGEYKYADRSTVYRHEEPAVVFNVIVSRNQEGKPFAKVQLMIIRECTIGDKFSMRSGQKGVAGNIMDEEDMPFTESGIVPDVIFNPHSLPSRMTINTLMEILLAKVCALKGVVTDGTMFRKTDMPSVQKELAELGFNPSGKERMYNGMNGKWIDYEIFIGPVYYQRLQKFVNETIYAVSHGSTDATTRQPLDGKSSNGGHRVGEMEKDVLISNGLSRFLSEKFYDHSDRFKVYICRGCGKYATVNHKIRRYWCKQCGDNADISEVDSSWTSKLFIQEMHSMNIGSRPSLTPYEYEKY
jgi:DNA-directed RNA polymerase beta subunit